jgi:hypothetical protein
MKFRFQNGEMIQETGQNIMQEMKRVAPLSTALIVDIPNVKKSIKQKSRNFLTNTNFALAPLAMGATGAGGIDGAGVFWDTFLTYIFPWMLDIAKVYCLVRIAQAFYKEKRGGSDSGTGFSALIEHGKWYLIFWLLPIGVELIDQMGHRMFTDLQGKSMIPTNK